LLCSAPRMRRLLLWSLWGAIPAAAQTLTAGGPANGFQVTTFVSGLTQLTDFRFLPDGRVVVTEKTGVDGVGPGPRTSGDVSWSSAQPTRPAP